jgi:hypothetical protein
VFIVVAVLSILLALGYAWYGMGKLMGNKQALIALDAVGVGPQLRNTIGVLEILGAAGLVAGLWLAPIGIAAATGLALLMAGALVYHLRVGHRGELVMPGVLLALTAATAVLRILTA